MIDRVGEREDAARKRRMLICLHAALTRMIGIFLNPDA